MPWQPSNRPKWILFDAAGTLLRPEPDVAAVYERVGREHGFSLSRQKIREAFPRAWADHFGHRTSSEQAERQSWRRLVQDIFQAEEDRSHTLFEALWNHFAHSQSWRVFDDVQATWDGLRRNGYSLAIASNFDQRLFRILSNLRPLDDATHVFVSARIGHRKPSRPFFQYVEKELGLAGRELLLVGDDLEADYRGAVAAGWQALHLDRSLEKDALPVIHRLTSVLNVLA